MDQNGILAKDLLPLHHSYMIMKKILTPKQSLLKGYLKATVKRDEIQLFKDKLRFLLERINPSETEEYNKNLFMQFLNQTYYTAQEVLSILMVRRILPFIRKMPVTNLLPLCFLSSRAQTALT